MERTVRIANYSYHQASGDVSERVARAHPSLRIEVSLSALRQIDPFARMSQNMLLFHTITRRHMSHRFTLRPRRASLPVSLSIL